jgi:hypothetical protein
MDKHSDFTGFGRVWRRQNLASAARPKGEPTGSPLCDEDLTFHRLTGVMVFFGSIRIGNGPLRARLAQG